MDATKVPQGYNQESRVVKHMDHQMAIKSNDNKNPTPARPNSTMSDNKTRPHEQLNCPRCNSTNTKFCYYNNYSLTQPRYLCKTCRRYWTEGGSLRNVPVGGGSRKNKRSNILSSSSSSTANNSASITTSNILPDLNPPFLLSNHQNPKTQKGQDLNLSFPSLQDGGQDHFSNSPSYFPKTNESNHANPNSSSLELLRTGIASRGLNGSFPPVPVLESNTMYNSSGFSFQQGYKPTLGFSIDGFGNRSDGSEVHQEIAMINGSRVLIPFGEMKQLVPSTASEVQDHQQNFKRQNTPSYELWNGMLSRGQSW